MVQDSLLDEQARIKQAAERQPSSSPNSSYTKLLEQVDADITDHNEHIETVVTTYTEFTQNKNACIGPALSLSQIVLHHLMVKLDRKLIPLADNPTSPVDYKELDLHTRLLRYGKCNNLSADQVEQIRFQK